MVLQISSNDGDKLTVEDTIFLIGRILLAIFYTMMAIGHFTKLEDMIGYSKSKGIPFPKLAVLGTGILLLISAISFGFGFYPLIGIITSTLFFLVVTPMMHNFWTIEDPMQKQGEMANFFKNMAIMASSLMFIAISEW